MARKLTGCNLPYLRSGLLRGKAFIMRAMRTVKDYIFYGLQGNVPTLFNLILIPLYLQVIDLSAFGVLTLMLVAANLFTTLVSLNLPVASMKFMHVHGERGDWKRAYSTTLLVWTVCVSVALSAGLFCLKPLFHYFFPEIGMGVLNILWLPAVLIGFGHAMRGLFETMCRAERQTEFVFLSSFVMSAVNLALALGFFFAGRLDLESIIWLHLCAVVCSVVVLVFPNRQFLCGAMASVRDMMPSVRYSLGLLPHTVSKFLFNNMDKFILLKFLSAYEVGIYAVLQKVVGLFSRCVLTGDRTFMPIFLKNDDEIRGADGVFLNKMRDTLSASFVVNSIGFCVFLVLVPWGISLLSSEAVAYWPLVMVMAIAWLFNHVRAFYVYQLLYAEKTFYMSIGSILMGLISFGSNVMLIPVFGMWGVALSFLVTYAAGLLLFVGIVGLLNIKIFVPALTVLLPAFLLVLMASGGFYYGGSYDVVVPVCAAIILCLIGYRYTVLASPADRVLSVFGLDMRFLKRKAGR